MQFPLLNKLLLIENKINTLSNEKQGCAVAATATRTNTAQLTNDACDVGRPQCLPNADSRRLRPDDGHHQGEGKAGNSNKKMSCRKKLQWGYNFCNDTKETTFIKKLIKTAPPLVQSLSLVVFQFEKGKLVVKA